MPIMTSMLAASVVSYLMNKGEEFLLSKGLDAIWDSFKSDKEDFEKRLNRIIKGTITEFEQQTGIKNNGNKFYDSDILLRELLKYRFTGEIESSEVQSLLEDTDIDKPDDSEIEQFLRIFTDKVNADDILKKLNFEYNYKEEVFSISQKLDGYFNKMSSEMRELRVELQGKGSAELLIEWNKQLEEIEKNIQEFKPKTALDRIINLEKRFIEAGILNKSIESKLYFLKATCYSELNQFTKENNGPQNYIKAYSLNPSNRSYKELAATSYWFLKEKEKALKLADELYKEDEYNMFAWLIWSYAKGDKYGEFQKEIPEVVLKNKAYQINLCNWVTKAGLVERLSDFETLGIDILLIKDYSKPEKITYNNRVYWVILVQLLLLKYFQDNPIQSVSKNGINLLERERVLYLNSVFEKIYFAIQGTEVELSCVITIFEYYYTSFLISRNVTIVEDVERAYQKIENPPADIVLQMAMIYNLSRDKSNINKAALLLENCKDKTESIYTYCIVSYAILKDFANVRRVFREHLHYIKNIEGRKLDGKDLYNLIQYFDTMLRYQNEARVEDYNFLIDNYEFIDEELSNLFQLYITGRLKKLQTNINIDEVKGTLVKYYSDKSNYDKDILATVFSIWGRYDDAIDFIESYADLTKLSDVLMIYCDAMYHSSTRGKKEALLKLLENNRLNGEVSEHLLRMEAELRRLTNDWQTVKDITYLGVKKFPKSHELAMFYLYACDKLNDVESIVSFIPRLKQYSDVNTDWKLNIATFLFKAGQHKESAEYLYELAYDKNNTKARQSYLSLFIQYPEKDFPNPIEVSFDSYVTYIVDESSHTIFVQDGNELIKDIIGKKVDETFKIGTIQQGNLKIGKIIAIRNKYTQLFTEIMKDAENPALGMPFQKFQFNTDDPNEMRKMLIEKLGVDGTVRKDAIDAILQDFYNGKISFSECTLQITDDPFESFYHLTSKTSTCFRSIPSGLLHGEIADAHYVLDITSLLMLFDLSEKMVLSYNCKFVISSYIKTFLQAKINDLKTKPRSTMSMHITMDSLHVTEYPENYHELQIEKYNKLWKWVEENCTTAYVEEKLDLVLEDPEKNFGNKNENYFQYILDTKLLGDRSRHVLVTLDTFYHKMGISNGIMSIDEFLRINLNPGQYLDARNELISRRVVGVFIDAEILKRAYMDLLQNQSGDFGICLFNVRFSWNMNPQHFIECIKFIRALYLMPFLKDDQRSRATVSVFKSLLHGADDIHMSIVMRTIEEEFKLLPIEKMMLLEDIRVILTTLQN